MKRKTAASKRKVVRTSSSDDADEKEHADGAPEPEDRKVEAMVSIASGVCDVLLLCTRFEYRRKRYATTLMNILTQFCREVGVHQVVAGVSDANAMKFWMSLGFSRSGRVRRDVVHFGKATLVTLNLE